MSTSVEKIKEKLGIEEVIGSYIKLERAGNNLKAKCPFHNEKTPSFFVSPDRGGYYCFGCGAKGDIFSFVQNFESVDFIGALKILADRAGIELEKFSKIRDDGKNRLYTLMEATTIFLQNNLLVEKVPTEYLHNRGLTDKTIKNWRVGYVRDEWRSISDHLKSKGFTDEEIKRAGITKTEGNSTYDRFRGRIMFPIFDSAGRTVAFSGRILPGLDDKSAKYLNSPQTEIFDKSKILYGYDKAKQSIRKFDFSILVEGQMDIIMCHQAGFTNTVASSGTALTKEHLSILKRISNKIIMSFDSDNAGAKAVERGWSLAISLGMDVKVAAIPSGFDPADLILKDKDKFKEVLKNSVHIIDFLLDRVIAEDNNERKIGQKVRSKILPYIALFESDIEKSHYVRTITKKTGIAEDAIWSDLKKVKIEEVFQIEEDKSDNFKKQDSFQYGSAKRSLASILAFFELSKSINKTNLDIDEKIKDILRDGYDNFRKILESEKNELSFEAESYYGDLDEKKIIKEIEYLLLSLREEKLRSELAILLSEMKKAEEAKDDNKSTSILMRCNDITKMLNSIKVEKNKKFNY